METQPGLQSFVAESRELLQAMEAGLLQLERSPADAEALNAVFRAAHTIKGSSGVFGFQHIVDFTHAMEEVLADLRAGDVQIDAALIALLLSCGDHCGALIAGLAQENFDADGSVQEAGRTLIEQLEAYLGSDREPRLEPGIDAGNAPATNAWKISVQFGKDVLRSGMDPLSFIRYLATLGTIESLATHWDSMPPASQMDPESCFLGVQIAFRGAADKQAIEQVFEFVRDDCVIDVTPAQAAQETPDMTRATASQAVTPVIERRAGTRDRRVEDNSFVRVRADKLDELITLIGELVIAGAGTSLLAHKLGNSDLIESTTGSEALVEQIRDRALKLRMVPIGETFARFNRVVHDLGRELGKEIELVVSGSDTELDKSMIEKVADPLMHLVRNALDHGIESAQARAASGKPAVARLALNAFHESGNIVIEVADDGRGLDRPRILARAIERGMIAADAAPSDEEIFQLIMEPGFSTAETVTNVSGRGMGMDVVKRNIESMRGGVSLESVAGRGTTVVIRLPLTLAIIDGFLVGVGRSTYVVPLDMVVECMELSAGERAAIRGRSFINLRDKVLPLLRLRDTFEIEGEAGRRENIVVVNCGGRQAGLVVDSLQGEFQTVIKPLGRVFEHLGGISGSTILGSGDVALILDVPALVQRAVAAEAARQKTFVN